MGKSGNTILVTGGAGFIGSALVKRLLNHYPNYRILNLDKLTYAGSADNLTSCSSLPNYRFIQGDIADAKVVHQIFEEEQPMAIINLAAESHVDRSIKDPLSFVRTNVEGTVCLLNAALKHWKDLAQHRFFQVATDEVYGSLGEAGTFDEQSNYNPNSPYSASKAAANHFVNAYHVTYGLNTVISNCSNNYGPFQFPEKLIPVVIQKIKEEKAIPVYGRGENIRDWIHVEDHVAAIDLLFHQAKSGSTYNIGAENEWKNLDLIHLIGHLTDKELNRSEGAFEALISFVPDRLGHDFRYALSNAKIKKDFSWQPEKDFLVEMKRTVSWYLQHQDWVQKALSRI